MIEVNLVPDVKKEFLRARKIRNIITFSVIIATSITIAITGILAFTVFVVQQVTLDNLKKDAETEYSSITRSHADLDTILTIQNQLTQIDTLNSNKFLTSRLFNVLVAIVPTGENDVKVSEMKFDRSTNTLSVSGHGKSRFIALDAFRKTIERTTYSYPLASAADDENVDCLVSNDKCTAPKQLLSGSVNQRGSSLGRDSDGNYVLRFELDFKIASEVLDFDIKRIAFISPSRQNVTDSYLQIPTGIFEGKAGDADEGNGE